MNDLKFLTESRSARTPINAATRHFPLACYSVALLLDSASWILLDSSLHLVAAAFWTMMAGVICSFLSSVVSLIELSNQRLSRIGKRQAVATGVLTLMGLLLFAASAVIRFEEINAVRAPMAAVLTSLSGLILMILSSCFGSRVLDEQELPRARSSRMHGIAQPDYDLDLDDLDEYSPVCHVDEFIEGGTLRANIRGTLITIAKSEGEFFAVQEFCTHRFGPLSEGKVENGQITCPWHQSCFDLRTGHVTEGCAKVPLRTYAVEIRANRIYVKVPVRPRSSAA